MCRSAYLETKRMSLWQRYDATETMIERSEERFALKPNHLAANVAYGTGEILVDERGVRV